MAAWSIFKVSRKTFFNPSAWIGADTIKTSSKAVWGILRGATTLVTPTRTETYSAALKRLKVTDETAQKRGRTYLLYACLLGAIGVLSTAFSFYLLFKYTVHGWFIGLAASSLFFAQAFRFHFWYFQIKNRHLGCTFAEWRAGKLRKSKPE